MGASLLVPRAAGTLVASSAAGQEGPRPTVGLAGRLHVEPTNIRSYRLLSMNRDEDGSLWAGSIHRASYRYDPRSGLVETIQLPYDATASACLRVGDKMYILGQTYPRLIIHDRSTGSFREVAYPLPRPDVWYGVEAGDDRHPYLFDRGSVGVIKWDSRTDTGKVIPRHDESPPPSGGRIEPRDQALCCYVWDLGGDQYRLLGIARLDPTTDSFTDWYASPQDEGRLEPFQDSEATFFLADSPKGKLVPFDFRARRWCRSPEVHRFGELFGFLGGPVHHEDHFCFSLRSDQ